MKIKMYITLIVPRLLNFAKKVGLLKFKIGNKTKANIIGTVLYKSQNWLKVSSDFLNIGTEMFLCDSLSMFCFGHITVELMVSFSIGPIAESKIKGIV